MEVEVLVQTATSFVKLNSVELVLYDAKISSSTGESWVAETSLDVEEETATLTFPQELPVGTYRLFIRFSGVLGDTMK